MQYKHLEGDLTTIDVWTQLTTQIDVASPGPLLVPGGKSKIKQILVSCGNNTPTAAESGWNWIIKMDGPGMRDGEQTFGPAGYLNPYTTAGPLGDAAGVYRFDVDLNVTAGGQINIYGMFTSGVITGNPSLGVTLGFA